MRIKLTDKTGAVLGTANRYVPDNITITPNLQEITVKTNGEFSVDSGYCGISKVIVNVPNADVAMWDGEYTFEEIVDVEVVENLFNVGTNLKNKSIIYKNQVSEIEAVTAYLKENASLSASAANYYMYVNFYNSTKQLIIKIENKASPKMYCWFTYNQYDLGNVVDAQGYTFTNDNLVVIDLKVGDSSSPNASNVLPLVDDRILEWLNANIVQVNPRNVWHYGVNLSGKRLSMIENPDYAALVNIITREAGTRASVDGKNPGNRHLCLGYSEDTSLIDIKLDIDGTETLSSNFRSVIINNTPVYIDYPNGYLPEISRNTSDINVSGALKYAWVYDDSNPSTYSRSLQGYLYELYEWLTLNTIVEKTVEDIVEVIDPTPCAFVWEIGANLRGKTVTIKDNASWASYSSIVTSTGLVEFGDSSTIFGSFGKAADIAQTYSSLVLNLTTTGEETVKYIMFDGAHIIRKSFTFPDTTDIIITARSNDSTISNVQQLAWLANNTIVSLA